MNKIKGQMGIDNSTLICLLVIILVAFGSFGLGRLSVVDIKNQNNIKLEDESPNIVKGEIGDSITLINNIEEGAPILKERMYVASKNGKLYYSLGCAGAKRILEKNQVWFATKEEAEDTGYSLSTSCK